MSVVDSVFTVEQVELIRRLRQTGIRPDLILQAYDSLDRIEQELGHKRALPPHENGHRYSPHIKRVCESPPEEEIVRPKANPILLQHLNKTDPVQIRMSQHHNMITNMITPKLYGPRRTPPPLRPEVAEFTTLDNPEDLEQFVKKGEDACIHEIKSFVSQMQLRQTTVAQMTGISQPYVSKFLNGNYRELSLRVRHLIFKWYLNCQKKPERLAQVVADPLRNHTSLPMNHGYDNPLHRRERYVFRPIMIPILERHFHVNPYPDLEKRMEIASECNRALQLDKRADELVSGTPMLSKDLVSPQIIANWFANKRKDMKRRQSDSTPPESHCWGNESPVPTEQSVIPGFIPGDHLANSVLATQYAQLIAHNLQNMAAMPQPATSNGDSSSGAATPNGSSEDNDSSGDNAPKWGGDNAPLVNILQNELAAVSNSVLALVNPYGDKDKEPYNNGIKENGGENAVV